MTMATGKVAALAVAGAGFVLPWATATGHPLMEVKGTVVCGKATTTTTGVDQGSSVFVNRVVAIDGNAVVNDQFEAAPGVDVDEVTFTPPTGVHIYTVSVQFEGRPEQKVAQYGPIDCLPTTTIPLDQTPIVQSPATPTPTTPVLKPRPSKTKPKRVPPRITCARLVKVKAGPLTYARAGFNYKCGKIERSRPRVLPAVTG